MEIKVKKTTATADRTTSTLSFLEGVALSEASKDRVKQDVGDFLVEQTLLAIRKSDSPVEGESIPALSPKYKKKKLAEGLPGKANLEHEGDLLDALSFEPTADGIEIGWVGDQAPKADGHADFSGKSNLPRRRIIPGKGQSFDAGIVKDVEKIVADAVAEELDFKAADFADVTTKADLYDVLGEVLDGMSRAEIRSAVTRTPKLANLLDDLGLFSLL